VNKKSQVPCGEEVRLLSAYNAAALEFATAMANLEDRVGGSSIAAYESLSRNAEIVRIKFQAARLDLETHIFKHSCEGSIPINYAALSVSAHTRCVKVDTSI